MKKFFRDVCRINSCGLGAFFLVAVYLYFVWLLIMTGSLFAQILAVLLVLCFLITALIGGVSIFNDVSRAMIAKKKKSAPTEVSAECCESSSFGDDLNDG